MFQILPLVLTEGREGRGGEKVKSDQHSTILERLSDNEGSRREARNNSVETE